MSGTHTPLPSLVLATALFGLVPACEEPHEDDDHDHDHDHETEVITRVTLTLRPDGGGAEVSASFSDPDGPGGMSGSSDPIALDAMTSYSLSVTFGNELEDPPEDVTPEILEEADEHQIFFYGSAIDSGLLTHAYADTDDAGLPVGLTSTLVTGDAGSGELRVRLQHLPALNEEPQKTAGLAERFPDIGGDTDADVAFTVTVE
jgi:hypothetical protein